MLCVPSGLVLPGISMESSRHDAAFVLQAPLPGWGMARPSPAGSRASRWTA